MDRPRSRRTLLASVATTAAVTTGGVEYNSSGYTGPLLEAKTLSADRYECSDVDRPEPDPPDDDDALEPGTYPSPPWETRVGETDTSSSRALASVPAYETDRYVVAFERTYRRNDFVAQYGSVTRRFEFRNTASRTVPIESAANGDALLVAIRYDVTTGTRHVVRDTRNEWDVRVSYYLDENIVLRAQYDGIAEELTFEPDPRTQGDLVACFD